MAADAHVGGVWQRVGVGKKYKCEERDWEKFRDMPTGENGGATLKKP